MVRIRKLIPLLVLLVLTGCSATIQPVTEDPVIWEPDDPEYPLPE